MKYIIYRISILNYTYIGSTKDFKQRKISHKKSCNNINSRQYNLKVYQIIRENGGWINCEMIPIEEFECENKTQSLIREEYWRKEYDANMNTIKSHTTPEERKIQCQVSSKKRYEENKDVFKEQARNNRIKNAYILHKHNDCECGGKYTTQSKAKHARTKKHLEYLELNKILV
jgi:hypothetical protein